MTEPCPPSICEASQAETESIELDFLHGGLYWQFVSRTQGSQVCVLLLGWLAGWRTDPLRCRRPKAACALLMCCHSPAGWAGLDRLRWRSPSFPQLIQADFAWLMNCDEAQLQGCLCFFLFFSFLNHKASQSETKCETLLKLLWWLSTFASAGSAAPVTHSTEHLKDPHCQDVRVAHLTASCLCFNTKKKSANNVTNLPGHDLPCTT